MALVMLDTLCEYKKIKIWHCEILSVNSGSILCLYDMYLCLLVLKFLVMSICLWVEETH